MKFSSGSRQSSGFSVLLNVSSVVVSKYVERSVDVLEYMVGEPVTLLDSSDCEVNEVVSVVLIEVVSLEFVFVVTVVVSILIEEVSLENVLIGQS